MKKKIRSKAELGRIKRHYRIRKSVRGTSERPRLSVHRSTKNLYVQFVDDISHKTILSLSTGDKAFKDGLKTGGNVEAAKKMGAYVAGEAKKKGIEKIVFDRG
ncbi:MAG: 50S ribosomal protein L18, partial [Candidatus Omnitrophota bacterium]